MPGKDTNGDLEVSDPPAGCPFLGELTKDQGTAAPEYKEDAPIVVLGAAGSLKPLQFNP